MGHDERRHGLKRVLPLLAIGAVAAVAAPTAQAAAIPQTDGVAAAAISPDERPRIAFVRGRQLWTGRGAAEIVPAPRLALPDATGRVAGIRGDAVLVESRSGTWLRLVVFRNGRWRAVRVADAPKDATLGRAGLALNRGRRPVVAFSVRLRNETTELWLVQQAANGSLRRTRVTRRGFPLSRVPPAAAPVLMPNGTIRVVQTFVQRGANAIFWRREGNRWWGRVLFASALGVSDFPVFTALADDDLFLTWTVAYFAQQEQQVLLTTRIDTSRSIVVHRNAEAAGLALGPNGPEVAANEIVDGLPVGLVLFPFVVNDAIQYSPPIELDGTILGYVGAPGGRRQVLLARDGHVEWFSAADPPHVRIFVESGLSGRVEGAAAGTVRIYRERVGQPRVLVAEAVVGPDGRFSASDPAPVSGWHYRLVYTAELPYSVLVREPIP